MKQFESEISKAMDLIDNVIGPIDKQTHNPREGFMDTPRDAEFEVTITEGARRDINKAWHTLSEVLRTIRAGTSADVEAKP